MKKLISLIKITVLSLIITLVPMQKSKAAVAGVAALAGASAAGNIALAGLASPVIGFGAMALSQDCDRGVCAIFFFLGFVAGVVLLDEETKNFEFSELDNLKARELGIDQNSIEVFNSEVADANILMEEVSSQLNENSSVDEARGLWKEYRDYLSSETFEVMQILVSPSN